MGVFTVDDALRAAAIDAGHELGVFEALASPLTFEQLAERTQLQPTHRLAALVDALISLGALARAGSLIIRGAITARSAMPMPGGWGAIADVIRTHTPLAVAEVEIARRYQRHLVVASAPAARDVAAMLVAMRGASSVDASIGIASVDALRAVDIGGGAGAYTRALLAADPHARVTLVDMPEVIALAREELADIIDRVDFVAGDARGLDGVDNVGGDTGTRAFAMGGVRTESIDARPVGRRETRIGGDATRRFDLAIVANVLHLHPPATCAELCASAARSVAPGGIVAIVDLRRGTLEGEMFALNMALYTDGGSVYAVDQVGAWLREAGLDAIEERRIASAPEMVVVLARRPHADSVGEGDDDVPGDIVRDLSARGELG